MKIKYVLLFSFLLISFFSACTTTQKIEKGEGIVDGHEVAVESEEEIFSLSDFLDTLYVSLRNNGLEKTLGLFDTLPEEAEGDFTIEYLHASLLFSANDYDAAAEIANRLAVENPNNADVMYLRAMIAKGQGKLTEKNALLKQMIAEDPTNPEANVELANDQMLRKNFGLAKRYFQTSLSSDPTNPDAMLGLGQSAYYTGDLKMSKDILTRMTEIYPEESMGWFFLAKLAGEEENYKKAGDYIETALSIEPDYYDYWSDYGIYLRYQGRSDEAEKAWSRAIDLNDEAFYAYIHRASLYDEKEDLDKAL